MANTATTLAKEAARTAKEVDKQWKQVGKDTRKAVLKPTLKPGLKRPRQLQLQPAADVALKPPFKVVIRTTTKTKSGYVMQKGPRWKFFLALSEKKTPNFEGVLRSLKKDLDARAITWKSEALAFIEAKIVEEA